MSYNIFPNFLAIYIGGESAPSGQSSSEHCTTRQVLAGLDQYKSGTRTLAVGWEDHNVHTMIFTTCLRAYDLLTA